MALADSLLAVPSVVPVTHAATVRALGIAALNACSSPDLRKSNPGVAVTGPTIELP
jgi:hypothetical protein